MRSECGQAAVDYVALLAVAALLLAAAAAVAAAIVWDIPLLPV
jgi:hypothetical protein